MSDAAYHRGAMLNRDDWIAPMYPGERFRTEYAHTESQRPYTEHPGETARALEAFLIQRIGSIVSGEEIRRHVDLSRGRKPAEVLVVLEHPHIRVTTYELEPDEAREMGVAGRYHIVPVLKRSAGG